MSAEMDEPETDEPETDEPETDEPETDEECPEVPPVRALVLAGGGLKVAFQAGVLQVLLDEARTPEGERLRFPIADAASGGTFNLALLCQGLSGTQIADCWRRTRPLDGVSLNWREWLPIPMSVFTYDGFRRAVLRRAWALDWHRIRTTRLKATFNMLDVDEQRHETWSAAQMHESALIAAVTLPMWFPPVPLDRDGETHNYIDAVFATNANLEAAIDAGATELWVIWTESQRGLYRPGFVHEYFQMIEAVSNSRVRAVVDRIDRSNEAWPHGEFGCRKIDVKWLSAEVPAHYLFSLSQGSIADAVERGVVEGRKWCQALGLRVEPPGPAPTGGQVTFREHMSGAFDRGSADPVVGAADGAGTDTAMTVDLQVRIEDIDQFAAAELHHGGLTGSIRCAAFGGERPLTDGVVGLLWDSGDPTRKRLSYRFAFTDRDGRDVTLYGLKYVVNDEGRDLWTDTTTLYVHLFRGHFAEEDTPPVTDLIGSGMLTIGIGSFLYQLTTFRGTAGSSTGPLGSVARFGRFFLRQLWQVYGQPPGPEVLPSYDPPVSRRPNP